MAVLEGQPHVEVALQRATDGVAGHGAQQLAAFGLAGRRDGVVGELAAVVGQVAATSLITTQAYGSESHTQATNAAASTGPASARSSRAVGTSRDIRFPFSINGLSVGGLFGQPTAASAAGPRTKAGSTWPARSSPVRSLAHAAALRRWNSTACEVYRAQSLP